MVVRLRFRRKASSEKILYIKIEYTNFILSKEINHFFIHVKVVHVTVATCICLQTVYLFLCTHVKLG